MKYFSRRKLFLALLCLAFLFRLGIGLCSEFRSNSELQGDEQQTYLIGLKFYTTGGWPYFGSDVNPLRNQTERQLPGALQGLMIGLPLYLWPEVEAPYVWLNILSFSSLMFFAWYCTKLLPDLPPWFIWGWLMTAPWTLDYSTQVVNVSYVLPGSIVFFIGALETYPCSRREVIPFRWASFMMGLGLMWVMQFHLSWVLLMPYALVSLYLQLQSYGKKALAAALYFVFGLALIGCFIVPTYIRYGLSGGLGNTTSVISFNSSNILQPVNILVRFLALASYIIFDGGMIGHNTAEGLAFFRAQAWTIPLAVFLSLIGTLQIPAMVVLWFTKKPMPEGWLTIKLAMLATVCWIYLSFWFTSKKPHIYTFYVVLPVALIYSLYCWNHLLKQQSWQTLAKVVLVCGITFHIGLALHNRAHRSLYLNRSVPQAAIDAQDYRLLDERRSGALY